MFNSSQGSNSHYFLHGSSSQDSWLNSSETWPFKAVVFLAAIAASLIIRLIF